MGFGTLFGGMRIIRTVGFSITKLVPMQGFAAEMSASLIIILASIFGMPISSTLMIVGSVAGVGLARKKEAVRLQVLKKLACFWLFSLPGSALSAAFFFKIIACLV
jgi:PiT family inorganic phosphate transporter